MAKNNLKLGQRLALYAAKQESTQFFQGVAGLRWICFHDDLKQITLATDAQLDQQHWPEEDSTTRVIQISPNLTSQGATEIEVLEWLDQASALLGDLSNSSLWFKQKRLLYGPWSEVAVENSDWLKNLWRREQSSGRSLMLLVINPATRILLHIFPDEDFLYTQHRHLDL